MRISLFLLFLGLGVAAHGGRHDDLEERFLPEAVQALGGRLKTPEELPEAYKTVRALMERFFPIVQRRASGEFGARDFPQQFIVRIVDAPMANAVIGTPILRGMNGAKRVNVLVTTGLLHHIAAIPDPALQAKVLSGVLAHETAHLIDQYDPQGLEHKERMNSRSGAYSQAIETRTDIEAIRLLRESGLPTDSMYEAILSLQAGGENANMVSAYFSTHPADDLRTSYLRIATTLDGYASGAEQRDEALLNHVKTQIGRFAKEVPSPRTETQKKTLTLEEAADRFGKLSAPIDEQVNLWRGEENSISDAYAELVEAVRNAPSRKPLKTLEQGIERSMRRYAEGLAIARFQQWSKNRFSHAQDDAQLAPLQGANPLFSKESVRDGVFKRVRSAMQSELEQREFEEAQENGSKTNRKSQDDLALDDLQLDMVELYVKHALAGDESFRRHFSGDFDASIAKWATSLETGGGAASADAGLVLEKVKYLGKENSQLRQLAMEKLYRDKVLGASEAEGIAFLNKINFLSSNVSLPFIKRVQTLGMHNDPFVANDKNAVWIKNLAKFMWKHRVSIGLASLASPNLVVDWMGLGTTLHLPPEEMNATLVNELTALLGNPKALAREFELLAKQGLRLQEFDPKSIKEGQDDKVWAETLRQLRPKIAELLAHGDFSSFPKEAQRAARIFEGARSVFDPKAYKEKFKAKFEEKLENYPDGISKKELAAVLEAVFKELPEVPHPIATETEIARVIDARPWSRAAKRIALKKLFFSPKTHDGFEENKALLPEWSTVDPERSRSRENAVEVARMLLKNRVEDKPSELLGKMMRSFKPAAGELNSLDILQNEVEWAEQLLLSEIKRISRSQKLDDKAKLSTLSKIAENVFGILEGSSMQLRTLPQSLKEIRDSISRECLRLEPQAADGAVWSKLHGHLSAYGAGPETDRLFSLRVRSLPTEGDQAVWIKRHIWSGDLKQSLALDLVSRDMGKVFKNGVINKPELSKALNKIAKVFPEASPLRDRLIEKTLLELGTLDESVIALADTYKSTHWRAMNPRRSNTASAFIDFLSVMTGDERAEFARYLTESRGNEIPPKLESALDRLVAQQNASLRFKEDKNIARKIMKALQLEVKETLRHFKLQTGPLEKLPLVEFALASGKNAILKDKELTERIFAESLNAPAGSKRRAALEAFLEEVSAPYERSVAMAYMMTHREGDASGKKITPMFEIFNGVGMKGGQLASLRKIFGEELSAELGELKDSASAATLKQIVQELKVQMPAEQFKKIKRPIRILGAASIKTVMLVELQDGRLAVAVVRRPNAPRQVERDLQRAGNFVRGLRGKGALAPDEAGQLEEVLKLVKVQMARELDLRINAESIRKIAAVLRSRGERPNGWKIRAPDIMEEFTPQENVFFMEYAPGDTLRKFRDLETDKSVKDLVGKEVVDTVVDIFFDMGLLDADPHGGNILVDKPAKTISMIDYGQLDRYALTAHPAEADDLYHFSQFLRAVESGNVRATAAFGLALGQGEVEKLSADHAALLEREIARTFSKKANAEDRFIDLVRVFSAVEQPLFDRFSAGALKALMTLGREEYVDPAYFKNKIREGIMRTLLRKTPLTVSQEQQIQTSGGSEKCGVSLHDYLQLFRRR